MIKFLSALIFITFLDISLLNAQVKNSSYVDQAGQRVLQLSVILPVDTGEAWKLFTVDRFLMKWIAPVAHIELKPGGALTTNYDKNKSPSDSSSIKLGIPSYLQNELIIFKVKLNNNFSKKTQNEDENLQEIIQFKPLEKGKTLIISSMIGWG